MIVDDLKKFSYMGKYLDLENEDDCTILKKYIQSNNSTPSYSPQKQKEPQPVERTIQQPLDIIRNRLSFRFAKLIGLTMSVEIHEVLNDMRLRSQYDMPQWMYNSEIFGQNLYEVRVLNPLSDMFGRVSYINVGVFSSMEDAQEYIRQGNNSTGPQQTMIDSYEINI